MAQLEVELILTRQLATSLSVPFVLVGPTGDILFYNEAAETVLGVRFQETGPIKADDTDRFVAITDMAGRPLARTERTANIAITERRPAHAQALLTAADGTRREVEVTAIPLLGQAGHLIGAAVMFWERAKA
jgi:PAS domain-containing protein